MNIVITALDRRGIRSNIGMPIANAPFTSPVYALLVHVHELLQWPR